MEGRDQVPGEVYREVFGSVDDGLVLLDAETGRITDANDAFARIVGVDRGSLVGERLVSVTNNESTAAVAYAVAMVERAAAGQPQSFEWTDRNADGDELDLEVGFSPVAAGGATLVLGVIRDITEDRERERALVRRKERLEEFASVVSHDLRGPLNVIEGELCRHRETGADEHLDAVEAASHHLDRVVTDLLDLARDGRTIAETEAASLEEVARRAWSLVDGQGWTLEVEDVTLLADPGRLTRALENLFRNSVEHGSTGSRTQSGDTVEHGSTNLRSQAGEDSVEHGSTTSRTQSSDAVDRRSGLVGTDPDTLHVRVGSLPDGGGFFVADDGPGIPPATRERAFDPGFTTASSGTGLGLAIVNRIFEAHGWSVEVEESESGGARFVVRGVTTGATVES